MTVRAMSSERRGTSNWFSWIIAIVTPVFVAALIVGNLMPLFALVMGSLLPNETLDKGIPPEMVTATALSLQNYCDAGGSAFAHGRRYFTNTVVVAIATAIAVLTLVVPSAYTLTCRYTDRTGGSDERFQNAMLWGYVFPPIILAVPYAIMLKAVHINGLAGLILSHVAFCLPFAFFLMLLYCRELVPVSYHRALALDGVPWWTALRCVVLPRVWPGVLVVFLVVFVLSWNDTALSLVLTTGEDRTIGPAFLVDTWGREEPHYGTFAAAGVITLLCVSLPVALLLFVSQRKSHTT